MSRIRKTTAHHLLSGTEPEYDVNSEQASRYAAGRPKMPADLSEVARAEWKRITKELRKRGTLTRVDASALEVYVRLYADWRAFETELDTNGRMIEEPIIGKDGEIEHRRVLNPAAKMATQLGNAVRQYQKEFSATPASRERTRPAASRPKRTEFPEGSWGWYQQNKEAVDAAQKEQETQAPTFSESDVDFNA